MPEKTKKPIIDGLFRWPSKEPKLLAGRCKICKTVTFPRKPFCPNPDCKGEKVRENVEEIELSNKATLYSYSFQMYQPPEPFKFDPWRPFAIGMADFPEGIRIWGMVTRMENLKLGMPIEVTTGKLYEDAQNEYITWMWKPVS